MHSDIVSLSLFACPLLVPSTNRTIPKEFKDVYSSRRLMLEYDNSQYQDCPDGFTAPPDPLGDSTGHGTCVATIASGKTYGAAKRVSIVPVKYRQSACEILGKGWLRVFEKVVDDVKKLGIQKKAIINMSISEFMHLPNTLRLIIVITLSLLEL